MKLFKSTLVALAMAAVTGVNAETIAISNAKVHTVTDQGVLENATIVIEDGVITAINPETVNADTTIDAKGQVLTPGFIGSLNNLGLVEVGAVAASRDAGDDKADITFDISLAFNPKTTVIPYSRKGGITSNVVMPSGGKTIFAGQSSVVNLSGDWDSVYLVNNAVLVELGSKRKGSRAIGLSDLIIELDEAVEIQEEEKKEDAKDPSAEEKIFASVLTREKPLLVSADRASDLMQLLALKKKYDIDLVLVGAADAIVVAEHIAAANVPVIMSAMNNLPSSFDSLHQSLENAGLLAKAGVKVGLSLPGDTHNMYQLRYSAGNAVANGMDYDAAIAALTANIADIFNIGAGRIEVGKPADIVLWTGDPLEYSSRVEKLWIGGKEFGTESRQDKLRDRYMTDSKMPRAYTK